MYLSNFGCQNTYYITEWDKSGFTHSKISHLLDSSEFQSINSKSEKDLQIRLFSLKNLQKKCAIHNYIILQQTCVNLQSVRKSETKNIFYKTLLHTLVFEDASYINF